MTTPKTERTTKACRFYDVLLRFYPSSFRQEYGDTLTLQFRDEYSDSLETGKQLPLVRFWLFIVFDFLSSLLMEYQEEVAEMFKKSFFVYSAIAAGIATLLWAFLVNAPYTLKPYFFAESSWFLLFALGSLTLVGVVKATQSNPLFRFLPILVLGASFAFLPVPRKHSFIGTWGWLVSYLGVDEENAIGFLLFSYLILIVVTGIIALVKHKWLPGVILVTMGIVPLGLTTLVNWLPTIIPTLGRNDNDWLTFLFILLFTAAWFVIAWWLNKENTTDSFPDTLDTA